MTSCVSFLVVLVPALMVSVKETQTVLELLEDLHAPSRRTSVLNVCMIATALVNHQLATQVPSSVWIAPMISTVLTDLMRMVTPLRPVARITNVLMVLSLPFLSLLP